MREDVAAGGLGGAIWTLPRLQRVLPEGGTDSDRASQRASCVRLVELDQPVRDRAGEPFPVEPIRALDASHGAPCSWRLPGASA